MDKNALRSDLLAQLAEPVISEPLFDHLPDIVYFAKNAAGQYVGCNQTLVNRCGKKQKSDVIGRTAAELFPAPYGVRFLEQDLELIDSGQPLTNQLEVHLYPSSGPGWCLTTKLPLKNREGVTVGLVGFSRDLQPPDQDRVDFGPIANVLKHIEGNLAEPLRTAELAEIAGLSTWQLDQRIRNLFQMTTSQLILQFRMQAAARRLTTTEDAIIDIAIDTGYSDQSAFSRQFRLTTGLAPGEFRRSSQ